MQLPISVLFVNTDLRVGGQERKLVQIVRGLDRSRVRPVVVCLKEPGELAKQLNDPPVALYSRLLAHRLDVRVLWRLLRILRRERIDVVCTVGRGDKMFWGRLAGALARTSGIVSTLHMTRNPSGGRVLGTLDRMLTPITDAYVAVARGAAQYLVEEEGLPRHKVRVIHNGVDAREFGGESRDQARLALNWNPAERIILQIAMLRPEKGHAVMLAALPQVLAQHPLARLVLAGEGPQRAAIEAELVRLRCRDRVELLGQRADVARLLAATDVVVLPSYDRVETFPNCILEAMAASRPVVCSNVGSVAEMVEEGSSGLLIPAGNPGALAAALLQVLSNPELAQQMGEAGRQRVERLFPAAQMIRQREELFLELVRRRRQPTL